MGKRKRPDPEIDKSAKRVVVSPRRTSGRRQQNKRENGKAEEENGVVEAVNALPLDEFVARYVSGGSTLDTLRISMPVENMGILNGISRSPARDDADVGLEPGESCDGRDTVTYSPAIYSSATIPTSYFGACFNLIRLTSCAAYNASSSGWSSRKKREEMKLDDMRYLLLVRGFRREEKQGQEDVKRTGYALEESNGDGTRKSSRLKRSAEEHKEEDNDPQPLLGGFVSFMVTYEDAIPVLYCYEIHLHPSLQNRGIGKTLMIAFEEIARNIGGLKKTMLTVFRYNEAGRRFYERLGYVVDDFSPPPRRLRGGVVRKCDYLILSKEIENTDENDGSKKNNETIW